MMPDLPDILADLAAACEKAGGVEAWANRNRVSAIFVHLALANGTAPSPAILGALGYQSRTQFVKVAI